MRAKRPRNLLARFHRQRKAWWLAVASIPVLQTTGCFPDPIGAFNFELQLLINSTLINTVNVIVRNILGL